MTETDILLENWLRQLGTEAINTYYIDMKQKSALWMLRREVGEFAEWLNVYGNAVADEYLSHTDSKLDQKIRAKRKELGL